MCCMACAVAEQLNLMWNRCRLHGKCHEGFYICLSSLYHKFFFLSRKDSGSSKSMCLAMEMMARKGKIVTGVVMVWIVKGGTECTNSF